MNNIHSAFGVLDGYVAAVKSIIVECVVVFSHSFIRLEAVIFRLPGDSFVKAGQGISLGFSIDTSAWKAVKVASRELVPDVRNSFPALGIGDSPQAAPWAFSSG